jgi:hypothetical protein
MPRETETYLQTHTYTKQNTAGDELAPLLRECHTKGSQETEDRGEEDGTSTSEDVVEGVRDPSGAV